MDPHRSEMNTIMGRLIMGFGITLAGICLAIYVAATVAATLNSALTSAGAAL